MTPVDSQTSRDFEVWRFMANYAKEGRVFAMRRELGKISLLVVAQQGDNAGVPSGDLGSLEDLIPHFVTFFQDGSKMRDYITLLQEEGVKMWPGFPSYSPKAAPNRPAILVGRLD